MSTIGTITGSVTPRWHMERSGGRVTHFGPESKAMMLAEIANERDALTPFPCTCIFRLGVCICESRTLPRPQRSV